MSSSRETPRRQYATDAALGRALREVLPTLPPWAHAMIRAALTSEAPR